MAPLVWHEPTGQWLALTYAAANGLLRDRRFGRLWQDKTPVEELEPFNLLHRNQMMENEPPAHTRLRSLVASRSRAATSSGCDPACSRSPMHCWTTSTSRPST
jgi:hypothetical protein